MPKSSSIYICQQCGYQSSSFLGKCPECGTWNSLVEQIKISSGSNKSSFLLRNKRTSNIKKSISEVVNISDIEKRSYDRVSSTISEFDRVLGGGIVRGSVVLVSGDPGIGKSTLLTQIALSVSRGDSDEGSRRLARNGVKRSEDGREDTTVAGPGETGTLYVAGEESAHQIKLRVERIKKNSNLAVLNEVDVDIITSVIEQIKPPLVIIDSIQALETGDLESVPGSVSQVRETAHRLQRVAKSLHIPIFLVGHVTKEGTVAGPRTLEHLVDVVLSLEGETSNQFRILRSTKNRFGPTDEVGIFDMEETGMVEVKNPSAVFLDQKVNAPGSAVIVNLTGIRPILLEIQALVTKSNLAIPRRVGTGIDNNRLQLLVAVLQKRLGLSLFDQDIFVNVTGGIRITEPAADLGICMAIISSFKDQALDSKTVFIGEVGLLGELRTVRQIEKRATEAKKLGYKEVISSANSKSLTEVTRRMFKSDNKRPVMKINI